MDFSTKPGMRAGCQPGCPGCAHRHLSPDESELQKRQWLEKKLADWADRIQPLCGVEDQARWAYRDKVCLRAEWRGGGWQIGMPVGETVLAIPDCPVHSERVRKALRVLLTAMPEPGTFPLLYYVQNSAQVVLVLKTRVLPDGSWLNTGCRERLERAGVEGLWLHLHPAAGRKIFNKPGWHLIWGKARSRDVAGLEYGPLGFQQLIPQLYQQSITRAHDFLKPSSETIVIDLYSGNGNTLKRWSQAGAASIGVELGAQACECAARNAPDAEILRGKCRQRLPQLNVWFQQDRFARKTRLLYLNPPRTGLEDDLLPWITQRYRPARIAYLSCSAGTLARDLFALTRNGYELPEIIPYDFFPNTYHVETLALLGR